MAHLWTRLLAVVFLCALGCREAGVVASAGGLWVSEREISFDRTFIGFPTTRALPLHSSARSTRTAALEVEGPFGLEVTSVEVPAGAVVDVLIRFDPETAGTHRGLLRVTVEGERFEVALSGPAEVPLECIADSPCTTSAFDPVAGGCVATPVFEGSPCTSADACLTNGVCMAGVCVGDTVRCDDGNACTQDACDGSGACVHLEVGHLCPDPSDPCRVPACDPVTGCTSVPAIDGTACGPADCNTANVCMSGVCRPVPVPEGARCGLDTPCQGAGFCRAGVCDRPAATTTPIAWRHSPQDALASNFVNAADADDNLYWIECKPASGCSLVSVTASGTPRYRAHLGSPATPTTLLVVDNTVVTIFDGDGVVAHRTSDGSPRWTLPIDSLPNLGGGPGTFAPVTELREIAAPGSRLLLAYDVDAGQTHQNAGLVELDPRTGTILWSLLAGSANVVTLLADRFGNAYQHGSVWDAAEQRREAMLWSAAPSGALRWSDQTLVTNPLAVSGSQLLTWSASGIDAQAGTELWSHPAEALISTPEGLLTPLASGGHSWWIVAGTAGTELMKLATDGTSRWRVPLSNWGREVTQPILTDDLGVLVSTGVVGSTWTLARFDPDGTEAWRCELPPADHGYSTPILLDDTLVMLQRNAQTTEFVAFEVPNTKSARSGWSGWRGNPQRTNSER